MSAIPAKLRRDVVRRANNSCEYCRLSQLGQEARFHVDHIRPIVLGGRTTLDNLSLACVSCSLRKGARRAGIDPKSGRYVPLFNPRQQAWSDHFRWNGLRVVGRTPKGRATVRMLKMNRRLALAIRMEETWRGRHPPR